MANSDRFPAPDQLATTATKTPPPSKGILRRRTIKSCIPTLHWLHGDPIADFERTAVHRPAQRRLCPGHDLEITWDLQIERTQVILETSNIFHTPNAKDRSTTHTGLRLAGNPKTASPPSNASATRTKQLAK